MINQDNYWREQIHRVMPDLEINSLEIHQEGLVNDVLIVNHEWVIRMTKTEWGKELMDMEDHLMQCLQPQITLSVPSPVKRADGILVYPHLKGATFQREIWAKAEQKVQQHLADQLGQFLSELHSVPSDDVDCEIPHTLAPVTQETWLDIHERFVEKVMPLLLPHQTAWAQVLFEKALGSPDFFNYEPVLIHGDLTPYHILYSHDEACLNAVIDFGIAGLGDPAVDLGGLISSYGETLVVKLAKTYQDYEKIIDRARFYAHALELQWVLLGVETGEYYWFTSHLGGARDIG